jgi:hypothetical protein
MAIACWDRAAVAEFGFPGLAARLVLSCDHAECLLIRVDRKSPAHGQNGAFDLHRPFHSFDHLLGKREERRRRGAAAQMMVQFRIGSCWRWRAGP